MKLTSGKIKKVRFDTRTGLVPVIVQDLDTHHVLMLGYMNEAALKATLEGEKVTFYSRSKNRLWTKGETSGNYIAVDQVLLDCDGDALLVTGRPTGPICHTGEDTCFGDRKSSRFLGVLERIIERQKKASPDKSYTAKLYSRGLNKIAQKFGEEAVELVIESKDDDRKLFLEEAADLMYHFLVLLQIKGVRLDQVEEVLEKRHREMR
jgi:phosphoribosyl-ATP pyrophosphohydrolase/phosphoribosyl-AMP cyclohydrolase